MTTTPEPATNQTMSETEFQDALIEAAQYAGWLVHHDRPARTADGKWRTAIQGDPGFPDLLLVHKRTGYVIAAELKSAKGTTDADQERWLARFDAAGIETHLWRPADFYDALKVITGKPGRARAAAEDERRAALRSGSQEGTPESPPGRSLDRSDGDR